MLDELNFSINVLHELDLTFLYKDNSKK